MPKRSEIAAARVQVALIARRKGEIPEWLNILANTPMSQADRHDKAPDA